MIKLKNVSKYYYSKGVIATGFIKANLEFNIGEFVAITGESGSGKSTLVNVISGLESYEEGELYVNGNETSHYLEKDWEEYRRKYIGNIYQNFNIINSYTVYQNVELALSLNGVSKKERKEKVLSILKKVGLSNYRKTKVSKLSGGQKQRVAIARALAKEVPIIVADEPTGNLDKTSAMNIVKLLKEISKDKLVIIVTHNYEQVEDIVTRKITMHDGKVLEDKKIKEVEKQELESTERLRKMKYLDRFSLGFKNTFNVIPKFVLLFLVYAFIVCALMAEYASFKQMEYEAGKEGLTFVFTNKDNHRIVLNKQDRTAFTDEELDNIKNLKNVKEINPNDVTVDETVAISDEKEDFWITGTLSLHSNLPKKVDYGRLPEKENEIVIEGDQDDYYIGYEYEELLNQDYYLRNEFGESDKSTVYKIVGIVYRKATFFSFYEDYKLYVSESVMNKMQFNLNRNYSKITVDFMGKNHKVYDGVNEFSIEVNPWVDKGCAKIPETFSIYCDKYNCMNKQFTVSVENIYFKDSKVFNIVNTYNEKNINTIMYFPDFKKENYLDKYEGKIFINQLDYNELFDKGTFQISVFVKDIEELDETVKLLKDMGYNPLKIKDTLYVDQLYKIVGVFRTFVTGILVIALFFISYFIIKIILKSRNIYFSILRMLGASKNVCKELLIIELFVVSNISYFVFILLAELNRTKYLNIGFIDTVNRYFKFNDYIVLYLIITFISLLISTRYAKKLFKNSVMNTYREEI